MRTTTHNRREHGVALLLTILGLLLLTAVAAAMLFSSNTETAIAVNYRDKQVATYAALSGLQEARARLHPLRGDLNGFPLPLGTGATGQGPAPTNLPGPSNGQVLYVINPDPSVGETAASIAPWNPYISAGVPNPYFDKELCQEANMSNLGVTVKPPGSPCTAAPSNSCTLVSAGSSAASGGWCSYYDNSANANATFNGSPLSWQLKDSNGNLIPLPYKWVRITLKADNSAPVWVQTPGSPATGLNQVCWDNNPNQQIQKPSTAGVNCLGASTFSVGAVYVNNPGAGYSTATPPTVTFQGGGGSGATATAQLTTNSIGAISSTTQSAMGSGYTSPPTVTVSNPGSGTGATFQALVSGSPVTGLSVGTTNYCYPVGTAGSSIQVGFNPNPPPTQGGNASATVTMGSAKTCVVSAQANASCGGSLGSTLLNLSYSGFTGTVTTKNNGKLQSAPITITNVGNFGSGVPGSVNITSTPACTVTVSFTPGIQISGLPVSGGGEYITAPTANLSGTAATCPACSGTEPPINVSWTAGANNGRVTAVNVTNGGTGYAAGNYALTFTGGGGSGATYTAASLGVNTYVSGITVTSGGSGYITPPTVVIGGPGSGATATSALTGGQQLYLGPVYTLTSLAVTKNGARAMAQMEVGVTPPTKFQLGGALTIAGANPIFSSPSSAGFTINGTDHAGTGPEPPTCNGTPGVALPSIGVADSVAQSCVANGFYLDSNNQKQPCNGGTTQNPLPNTSGLGKPDNYIGVSGTAPDVQVVPGANPDPSQLQQVVLDIYNQPGTNLVGSPLLGAGSCTNTATNSCGSFTQASLPASTATNLQTTVVNGDLTISGSTSGYGVLVVTGNLTFNGNFTWHGLVLVIGTATTTENGGGNGQITGSFYVGNTAGSPSNMNWNGGGGNGINYDHCWADDLLSRFPPSTSNSPLQVLSTRMLEY